MTTRHASSTKKEVVTRQAPPRWIWVVYGATVLLFLGASFVPQSRLWGMAIWGYLPVWSRLVLAIVALVPLALGLRQDAGGTDSSEIDRSAGGQRYLIAVIGMALGAGVLFYLLRARTFFLGDGYTALANLSTDNPIIKGRELGESLAHLLGTKLLGGFSEANALLSYQGIAVVGGMLLVIAVGAAARYLFSEMRQRLLFLAGVISGGYGLLYFGYVENYSLFVLSVVCFLLAGWLALEGRLPRWLALLAYLLTVFFHVFGLILLPAAVYILIAGTQTERKIGKLSIGTKVALLVLLGIVVGIVLWALTSVSFFVQIALLSPVRTRFTISGYTLFSPAHLADFANLLLLVFPGLLVMIGLIFWRPMRPLFKAVTARFLAVACLSVLAGSFIIDPKLGMPRDWDLYSYVGVPLVMLGFFLLLDHRSPVRRGGMVASGLIVLNLVVLVGRVAVLASPERGLQQIEDYMALDPVKGKNATIYLINYYEKIGNATEKARWEARWQQYPDERLLSQADSLLQQGQSSRAIALLEQAVRENPMSAPAYTYLGSAYLRLQQCGPAAEELAIAHGLNPHSLQVELGLGHAYYCLGEKKKAEASFERAVALAPDKAEPYFEFAQYYKLERNSEKYMENLTHALQQSDVTGAMFGELGNYCMSIGQLQRAATAYRRGLQLGLDTAVVLSQVRAHPELFDYLRQ